MPSKETTEMIWRAFNRVRGKVEAQLPCGLLVGEVFIPFMDTDGVICNAVYSSDGFVGIEVPVAKSGILQAEWLLGDTVYCDEVETVLIDEAQAR